VTGLKAFGDTYLRRSTLEAVASTPHFVERHDGGLRSDAPPRTRSMGSCHGAGKG
jgi:hypothetical protein